jgi:hypothetical protein
MEVENKKARDAARKIYSEEVRSLAMWLKRRDPRVKEHEMVVAAAAAEAEKKRKEDAAAKSAAAAAAAAHRTSARAAMLKEALHRSDLGYFCNQIPDQSVALHSVSPLANVLTLKQRGTTATRTHADAAVAGVASRDDGQTQGREKSRRWRDSNHHRRIGCSRGCCRRRMRRD